MVELFVVPTGDGAALVVDAWTRVISLVLAGGAAGEVAGFAWEFALGTDWRMPVAADFGAAVEELVCPSERVMAPSNTAVPQIRCLKWLNISVNGKLKSAEASKAGSRPAPAVRAGDTLESEEISLEIVLRQTPAERGFPCPTKIRRQVVTAIFKKGITSMPRAIFAAVPPAK